MGAAVPSSDLLEGLGFGAWGDGRMISRSRFREESQRVRVHIVDAGRPHHQRLPSSVVRNLKNTRRITDLGRVLESEPIPCLALRAPVFSKPISGLSTQLVVSDLSPCPVCSVHPKLCHKALAGACCTCPASAKDGKAPHRDLHDFRALKSFGSDLRSIGHHSFATSLWQLRRQLSPANSKICFSMKVWTSGKSTREGTVGTTFTSGSSVESKIW